MALSNSTVYRMLLASSRRFPDRPALRSANSVGLGAITYRELLVRVRVLRCALRRLGVRPRDRVAILSRNRPEWAVCDLAIQGLGAVTVPIYHTLPAPQVQFYLRDSGAVLLFAEDDDQHAKIAGMREDLPALREVVLLAGDGTPTTATLEALLGGQTGTHDQDPMLDAEEAAVSPDDVATFIYTSGTTGDPKAAMLSHRALLYTSEAAQQLVRIDENDVFLSFLPLCHVVERVGGYYLPLSTGAEIVYSDGAFALASEIVSVKPTAFLCVPRLYETVRDRILDAVARMPPMRRAVARWALGVGQRCADLRLRGARTGMGSALLLAIADRMVLGKMRARATGGRVRFLVSGGAPLDPATCLFFEGIGVRVLEGFGLTEFPVISLNRPESVRLGTVGHALPGIEVRVTEAGEVIARGPSCMRGYHNRPEATAEAIDEDGWFHTGDVGTIAPDGRIAITDRIKDIIVLANGKNVAPQPIEAALKRSPYISEAVLFGDRRPVIVALVLPAIRQVRAWASSSGLRLPHSDDEVIRDPRVRSLIKGEIARHSTHLADFERVRRFALVVGPFAIESGELTPTLKVKRRVVAQRYAEVLAELSR